MKDEDIWQRDEVASPCTNVCVIHPKERICTGCLRTMDEIAGWSRMDPATRKALIDELPTRAPRLKKRRGGRLARLSGKI